MHITPIPDNPEQEPRASDCEFCGYAGCKGECRQANIKESIKQELSEPMKTDDLIVNKGWVYHKSDVSTFGPIEIEHEGTRFLYQSMEPIYKTTDLLPNDNEIILFRLQHLPDVVLRGVFIEGIFYGFRVGTFGPDEVIEWRLMIDTAQDGVIEAIIDSEVEVKEKLRLREIPVLPETKLLPMSEGDIRDTFQFKSQKKQAYYQKGNHWKKRR